MATKSPVYCRLCDQAMGPENTLEQHLVHTHEQRELAKRLVSEWEAEELGDTG
ncbi:hypothetical protein SAMN04487967_1719 [Natronorubrum sediminis]|uniref:C2H2-type domain-containing protein n=1 Tax=Natronorubrum sediminis TaxID=640943 RepID=A0A1H6FV56_9EURY|nr:hypothetical protein [Natronorubrum sediminis]SEH14686.1 hypothetical protein SAMN04487967_1719 [Natronorubrum sediminis]